MARTGRLALYCTPWAIEHSIIVVVNGDRYAARIGSGQRGVNGPGGLEIGDDPDAKKKTDLGPDKITVYADIPVKAGRNTVAMDYQGVGFLWPAKTYPGVAKNFDFISFDLTPAKPLGQAADAEFAEFPLAGDPHGEAATVRVDLRTRWSLRGRSAIPKGLFGLTTFKAGSGLTTPQSWAKLKLINVGCVNGGVHPTINVPAPKGKAGKPADDPSVWERYEKLWASKVKWKPGAARMPVVVASKLGIDYHVNMRVAGWGSHKLWTNHIPVDLATWSDNILRLMRILKKHASQVEYVNFLHEDEPILQFSHLLRDADGQKVSGAEYAGLMERAAMRKIHGEFPDVKLIGPVHWGPPFGAANGFDFAGDRFEDWVRPYLEVVWDELYAFGLHNYHMGYTANNTGELQTLVNHMLVRFGEDKPIYMNEGHLGGGEWAAFAKQDDRALWLYDGFPVLRALMHGVKNLDKIQVVAWHDYGRWPTAEWATVRAAKAGLPKPRPRPDLGEDSPQPLWNALWLFRQLRGETLLTRDAPGTQTAAAFDGLGYSVVVINHSLQPRNLHVKLDLPQGRKIEHVGVEFAEGGPSFYRFDAGRLDADRWRREGGNVTIHAQPLSAYHVRVTLDEPAAPSLAAGHDEHFGDRVMVLLNRYEPAGEIVIRCDRQALDRAKRAWLRVAYESLLLDPQEVTFALNGKPVTIDRPCFIELPLDLGDVKAANRLTFKLTDPKTRNSFRVRSATIVTEF